MKLIKLLTVSIAFISIYMCADADAGDMMTTWTVPTTRVNGTPLSMKEISKYELRCVGINMPASILKFPKGGTKGYLLKSLKPGKYSCIIRTVDTGGLMSEFSKPSIGVVL